MNSILSLFLEVSSYIAIISMILPIGTSLTCWIKKTKFSFELKLFAIYVWVTLILQTLALVLSYGFGLQNLFLFRLHYPIHLTLFAYLLLKWLRVNNKNILLLVGLSVIALMLGDFLLEKQNTPIVFMIWFDVILLFGLSFLLSFVNDKKKVHLPKEYNFTEVSS